MDLNSTLEAAFLAAGETADPAAPASDLAEGGRPVAPWWGGLLAAAAWLGTAALTGLWPDADDFDRTPLLGGIMAGIGTALASAAVLHTILSGEGAALARLW